MAWRLSSQGGPREATANGHSAFMVPELAVVFITWSTQSWWARGMLLAEMIMKSGRRQGEERGGEFDVPHVCLVLDLTADRDTLPLLAAKRETTSSEVRFLRYVGVYRRMYKCRARPRPPIAKLCPRATKRARGAGEPCQIISAVAAWLRPQRFGGPGVVVIPIFVVVLFFLRVVLPFAGVVAVATSSTQVRHKIELSSSCKRATRVPSPELL